MIHLYAEFVLQRVIYQDFLPPSYIPVCSFVALKRAAWDKINQQTPLVVHGILNAYLPCQMLCLMNKLSNASYVFLPFD